MGDLGKMLVSGVVLLVFMGFIIGILGAASKETDSSSILFITVIVVVLSASISFLIGLFSRPKDK